MSTTTDALRTPRASYGNWVPMRSAGLFGTGLAATVVGLATPVFALLVLLVSGSVLALLFTVLAGAAGFTAVGTPAGPALARRIVFRRHRRTGGNEWRAGVFSPSAGAAGSPAVTLPGMAGSLALLEGTDPMGAPFVVVHDRRRGGLWTLVARCDADGPVMAETDQVDNWVSGWARFLATTGHDPALVAVKVIVDTAPDPGTRLAASITTAAAPGAPALAAAVMGECAATYPTLAAANTTWVEVTYRGRTLNRKATPDRVAAELVLVELARRVPDLLQGLTDAGGGAVTMATAPELSALVRAAYDPASRADSRAEGAAEVAWCDAGPLAAVEEWDTYRHDSGTSVTWQMHDAPRSGIEATALGHLLAPQAGLARKRVALLLRPAAPGDSARAAENDAATAVFNSSGGTVHGRVSAADSLRVRATEQARHEVAAGAVLVKFSVLVTATVTDPADLEGAISTVESAAGCVPLRLRRCHGSQAAAFATTLPIGFQPQEHTLISERARELL